ncbi:MAG: hypothetical protein HUJ25_07620 [Crocinitomicaceae bacterium]|nr:hypothetical protein [Crocinitomicaceae bacterium]
MREGTAIEIAKFKMKELGVGKRYILRYRHFVLDSLEKKQIKAENNLYILIAENAEIKIESKTGVFDLKDEGINEQQHIHRGLINLENFDKQIQAIRFIQVIPILKNEF